MKKGGTTIEEVIGALLMTVLFLCAIFQVFNRFLFHFSAAWTEEVCRYAFIWIALIGIANGVKRDSHLCVDLIDGMLPPRARTVLKIFLDAAFFLLMAYMFKISLDYLRKVYQFGTKSVGLGVKMWIIYLVLPIFSGLTMFRLVEKYIRRAVDKRHQGGEGPE